MGTIFMYSRNAEIRCNREVCIVDRCCGVYTRAISARSGISENQWACRSAGARHGESLSTKCVRESSARADTDLIAISVSECGGAAIGVPGRVRNGSLSCGYPGACVCHTGGRKSMSTQIVSGAVRCRSVCILAGWVTYSIAAAPVCRAGRVQGVLDSPVVHVIVPPPRGCSACENPSFIERNVRIAVVGSIGGH